jgi:hypothetical protein
MACSQLTLCSQNIVDQRISGRFCSLMPAISEWRHVLLSLQQWE